MIFAKPFFPENHLTSAPQKSLSIFFLLPEPSPNLRDVILQIRSG